MVGVNLFGKITSKTDCDAAADAFRCRFLVGEFGGANRGSQKLELSVSVSLARN